MTTPITLAYSSVCPAPCNGAFAGWQQVGGSDTTYAVVGVGSFYANGRHRTSCSATTRRFVAWNHVNGSDTHYSVVGVGDFYGTGTDDILFRNNSTGDMWFAGMSNGAFNGWHQVGGSDTTYAALGVVDYFGNRTADILFRNNSTGDTLVRRHEQRRLQQLATHRRLRSDLRRENVIGGTSRRTVGA